MNKDDLLMAALAFGAVVGLGMWWSRAKAAPATSTRAARYTPSTSSTSTGASAGYAGGVPADWYVLNTNALEQYLPSWAVDNPYG